MTNCKDHPTVKPVSLMQYLVRLVTPRGGIVLDPFMGSGSTGIAALRDGFRFIGIERDAGYFGIAELRIAKQQALNLPAKASSAVEPADTLPPILFEAAS